MWCNRHNQTRPSQRRLYDSSGAVTSPHYTAHSIIHEVKWQYNTIIHNYNWYTHMYIHVYICTSCFCVAIVYMQISVTVSFEWRFLTDTTCPTVDRPAVQALCPALLGRASVVRVNEWVRKWCGSSDKREEVECTSEVVRSVWRRTGVVEWE